MPFIDLIAKPHMFRSVERILNKKMDKRDLFGLGFVNGFDRTDQAVFQPRVFLFHESRELAIRRCPPQRQYQRFDDRKQDSGDQSKPQTDDCPPGNGGRIGEQKSDQQRRHHHAQNPGQASEPEKRLPSASDQSDFPEQLFMWCHVFSLNCSGGLSLRLRAIALALRGPPAIRMPYTTDSLYKSPLSQPIMQ